MKHHSAHDAGLRFVKDESDAFGFSSSPRPSSLKQPNWQKELQCRSDSDSTG
jgi:hypothetical protein